MSVDRVVAGEVAVDLRPCLRGDRNESLLGPPEGAVAAIRRAARSLHRYPVETLERATAAIAATYGVRPGQVLVTTGVDEATDLCLLHFDRCHATTPGFDGYVARADALRRPMTLHELTPGFALPRLGERDLPAGELLMLASPNNPTGITFDAETLETLLARGVWIMLDETYGDFSEDAPGLRWLSEGRNVVVFRSFSKSFGLAGLRIGALIGDPTILADLAARKAFCTPGALALEALVGALSEDPDYPARLAAYTRPRRANLVAALRRVPCFTKVLDTETNFVLALTDGPAQAQACVAAAATAGHAIKPAADLGLPGAVRITVREFDDNELLAAVLTNGVTT
ncbi:MAG: hypothetical protein CSA58_12665 [Micrococcales bacterium]|nr:MAG: hypothetical protein CSA58_12665 [Micrococcales bacterium]